MSVCVCDSSSPAVVTVHIEHAGSKACGEIQINIERTKVGTTFANDIEQMVIALNCSVFDMPNVSFVF